MSLGTTVDLARQLVILRAEADLTAEEFFGALTHAAADPRCGAGFDILYDRTAVERVPDPAGLRASVNRYVPIARRLGRPRLAVVAQRAAVFGMVRVAGVYAESEGLAVRAFYAEPGALAWLGRDTVPPGD